MRLRRHPAEIGWTVDLLLSDNAKRGQFVAALRAENMPMDPPSAATPLPPRTRRGHPSTLHESGRFATAQLLSRTIDLYGRAATLTINPKYTAVNVKVAAITKVYKSV